MTFEYMFTHNLIISQGYDPRVGELFPRGLNNESDAISKALEQNVTGSNSFDIYTNIPKHAGLGLFFLTKIIQETNGKLFIVSNNTIYHLENHSFQEIETSFLGTIICFEIEVDNINHDLKDLMNMIMYVEDEEDVF